MKVKKEMFDLLSLLKVFDANFVNDADCVQLQGLDVNSPSGVASAVRALLLPEFHTYTKAAQDRLTNLLRILIADPSENFGALFERVELLFDDEITDRRAFMAALLAEIEGA
ncbi:hypothetical protein [Chromobacterium violaceum]|nr:hypothetical protein [Chromobacterium violaceum]MBA8735900.1 hypothetical protein [Chromobacterium violaceum]MBP4050690.1 hypothetical protein [Chromobacterium violaceum]MCD0493708.1 hypothetical protein [Chromobacterium violaceum]OQS22797.1 hypothetical protein B0T41_18910 [Chromobacterium violaceum]QIY78300.1 hypothetical protein FOB43_03335 [Chromobacterium violaceum]